MVITCPSCKRRFNLPVDKVRSRTVKLKCSRCKSMFTQDLAALTDVATAKLSEAELGAIARLPAQAPPTRPQPAPAVPQPRPRPVSAGPITKPLAPVAPRPAAASTGPATKPWAPVTPQARPAPAVAPRPAPPPPPPPKPVEPVIQGYESYAEAPEVDEEHQEALERAAEAAEAQAALRAQEEAALRQAEERLAEERAAQAAQAAVDAALEQATTEAVENSGPIPEPPPAEDVFGVPASDSLPPDLVAGLDAVARGRIVSGDAPQTEAALRTTGPRNEAAADLFRGAQTPSGRFALAGAPAGADVDDFLLLSDEETPGPGRWIGLGLGILLALSVAAALFVLARNSWKLDTGHLGQQIRYAFWMGPPVVDTASCVATSIRLPALVKGQDGTAVVVWGLIQNICSYSVSGVSVSCKLEGPGGPWTDAARPFVERAPSDLSESALAEQSLSGMARAITDLENPVGVVLANQKHEVWCIFSGAAGPEARATQFRSSFQVSVP